MLHIFTSNYPAHNRAHYMKRPFIVSALSAILFGYLGGLLLDTNIQDYSLLFCLMAFAATIAAFSVSKIPSQTFSQPHRKSLESLSLIWKDRLFGSMLGAWMLLGIGTICLPIRYEYLANPSHGIDLNNAQIAFIMVAIPQSQKSPVLIYGQTFLINFVWWRHAICSMLFSSSVFCSFSFPIIFS